jgi:phage tail protein X
MSSYRTNQGDVLDAICRELLGNEAHAPAVLAANPGLADLGPVYAAGILITLPVVSSPVTSGTIKLWGRV